MIKTRLGAMIGGAFWTPGATILGSSSQNLIQLIKSIFANNEQGFAYDPNDLSTMFQDAADTIPVTAAGQPVGLMLDKSRGLVLGVEQVIGGDFESGLVGDKSDALGSVSTWELNTVNPISGTKDGKLTITTAVRNRPSLRFLSVPRNVGEMYEMSFDYKLSSGTAIIFGVYDGIDVTPINKTLNSSGRCVLRYVRKSTAGGDIIYFGESLCTIQIDNVSVKRVTGNYAYQTTSSMRPLLVASPQRLDHDTVDDKLITNLPAQLTGCTVVRAVPSVGTQILTNQTIPTPYNDSTDHCGLIVINRALTATETSQITKLFNKAAGV